MASDSLLTNLDDDGVLWVTIDRPDARNALSRAAIEALHAVADRAAEDTAVRCVVLQGNGRGFCSGHDLREQDKSTPTQHATRELSERLHVRWADLPVPTIAALHGFAFGSGLMLALACDFRVGSDDLKVGLPEVNVGMFPALGGTALLTRLVGPGRATQMILSGETYDTGAIEPWGLLSEVVAAADLTARVSELARGLAAKAPLGMRFAKLAIRAAQDCDLDTAHRQESLLNSLIRTSDDRREGIEAFREKRKPRFGGH